MGRDKSSIILDNVQSGSDSIFANIADFTIVGVTLAITQNIEGRASPAPTI